jgi:hypothetical protein
LEYSCAQVAGQDHQIIAEGLLLLIAFLLDGLQVENVFLAFSIIRGKRSTYFLLRKRNSSIFCNSKEKEHVYSIAQIAL